MKRNYLSILIVSALFLIGMLASCTKEGPAGPAGADGVDGTNGTDGTSGCIQCHDNSQNIESRYLQWAQSGHNILGDYDRNSTSCAPCHTSQGFLERMAAGTQVTAATIQNPMPQTCYTCHQIHSTYTSEDLNLTYADKVDYWFNPSGEETPDFGTGNLCANCHQSRISDPFPTVGSTETYTITSYRWGPHHGPMGNMLGGFSAYEIPGSLSYSNSPHTTVDNACVICHVGTYNATTDAGGHNMTANITDNCVSCHPDNMATATEEMMTEIAGLLEELHTKLVEQGIATDDGYLAGDNGGNASSTNPANLSANELGAFFNYKFVEEDKSMGVHNYKYAKAMLANSLEAL
jgi:formate-dependent nitrite reductase cytochrome c552 subunit